MKDIRNAKNESAERTIDLIPLLKALLKKLWLIVLVGVLTGLAVFFITKVVVKPTYRSGFTAYVNNKQSQQSTDYLTSSDVSASKQLVQTYKNILTSNTILMASAKSISVEQPYETLKLKVSTEIQDETEIIAIYVVDTDPKFAFEYAEAISRTAPQYMAEIVEGSSMKIIDYPVYNERRYKPSYVRFLIVGALIGALLVAVWIIIRYFMDDTITNEEDLESKFDIPILGVIPDIIKSTEKGREYSDYEYGTATQTSESKNEKK